MAKKPVTVTEDDYKADPDNVQRIETPIPGFADAEPLVTYVKVEYVDDISGKPAEDVETVQLLVPVEVDREAVETGDDGEPLKNADGSDKLTVVKEWDYEPREIDLSPANLKKLVTALKPYAEKSRPRVVRAQARTSTGTASSAPSSARSKWLDRVRTWANEKAPAAVLKGRTVADRGRVAEDIRQAYVDANPQDPEPTG